MKRWYSVELEALGGGPSGDDLDRLVEAYRAVPGLQGAAISWGGLAGGPGAQVSVEAETPVEAARAAGEAFADALTRAGIDAGPVVRVEVMTEEHQERWLAQEADGVVGVSEIAQMLGVSRQRVNQLRRLPAFPQPLAELAAGPVWHTSTLRRFVSEWPRRPGRPRRPAAAARTPA